MVDVWFTSDHHFGHANILKFTGFDGKFIRPEFSSVEEMDEIMAERWNSLIKPQDKVYHLGDFSFLNENKSIKMVKRLNGKKRIVLGNHDKLGAMFYAKHFEKVLGSKKTTIHELNLILTHWPIQKSEFIEDNWYVVHGHIHTNLTKKSGFINVCVEHTNYYPINAEELKKLHDKQIA